MGEHVHEHDYLPGMGNHRLMPLYDLVGLLLGMRSDHCRLLEIAELPPSGRVLEIGCGTGNLALLAKKTHRDIEMVGIDPDRAALGRAGRKAARQGRQVQLDHGHSQELPYLDGSFDRVLSAFMLHHLDSDTTQATLTEALRVLRPGGALLIADFGGHVAEDDGAVARRQLRSRRLRDNLGQAIPGQLRAAGFAEVDEQGHRHSRVGRVTYYRARR